MLVATGLMRTTVRVSQRTLLVCAPLQSGTVIIEGDEAHHGRVVLRLRPGDDIRLADGAGHAAAAVVTGVGREALEVEAAAAMAVPELAIGQLTIASAVPKGDRFADLIRGLTELGVGRYIPLDCERGERIPGNLDRARRIAAEALKQCQRGRHLEILPPMTLNGLIASGGELVVLDPQGLPARPGAVQATTLVIGPEGGLSTDESRTLEGFPTMRIAGTILRIETAAIAAAAVWAAAWEASSR
jgi:16S rRNA (uracil1498-N3)-methyltransferase